MSVQSDPKETNGKPQPATNDPEEIISTPEEVQESNDEKIDQDFPGYPHYPAKDDILNPDNYNERVDIDVENLTRSHTISPDHIKNIAGTPEVETGNTEVYEEDGGDIETAPENEADVTAEDLAMLGDSEEDMDLGEDEELRSRGWLPVTGKDLDIPGGHTDSEDALGQNDEENSYFSLGGDRIENLRENNDPNNF
jgi:hypothetical protein